MLIFLAKLSFIHSCFSFSVRASQINCFPVDWFPGVSFSNLNHTRLHASSQTNGTSFGGVWGHVFIVFPLYTSVVSSSVCERVKPLQKSFEIAGIIFCTGSFCWTCIALVGTRLRVSLLVVHDERKMSGMRRRVSFIFLGFFSEQVLCWVSVSLDALPCTSSRWVLPSRYIV
jgi:hypothetical protein